VASRPRVKRHRSISVDDRKYFDQYRAFRPNPLVRLSNLAPGLGRDRKRSDLALQTSDRRSQRQNFEQEVAEVTEITNWDAKKRRTAAGTFGWGRAPALPVEAKPSKTSRSKTLVESMAFFETKTRNALCPIAANSCSETSKRSPRSSVLPPLSL